MAAIPLRGGLHGGNLADLRSVGDKRPLLKHRQPAPLRVPGRQLNPAVDHHLLHSGQPLGRLENPLRRGIDHNQQAHRLVDFDGLPGEARPQVAGVPIHHADQSGDVVRQFRAATIAQRIKTGEEVGQINPRTNGADGGQRAGEDRPILIVSRIVRHEEGPAVEIEPAGSFPAADDAQRVGRMPQLRPHLRQIARTPLDHPHRVGRRDIQRHRIEPPAAFLRIGRPGATKGGDEHVEIGVMARRQPLLVKKHHAVGAGILHAPQKNGGRGDR